MDSPLLDKATAEFIRRHVAITVATRDAQNIPAIARAFGCDASPDLRALTIFLAPRRAAAVLHNLRATGDIAVVVGRPSTHETLQFKGVVNAIQPVSPRQIQTMLDYVDSLAGELTNLGFNPSVSDSFAPEINEECLAVTFEPAAVFVQTPGPRAGQRLDPRP